MSIEGHPNWGKINESLLREIERAKMKLFRQVPARTETVWFNWCRSDFLPMSQKFRDARARMSEPLDKCWWCKHPFENGEMMAMAQAKGGISRILCQACAGELLSSATAETEKPR